MNFIKSKDIELFYEIASNNFYKSPISLKQLKQELKDKFFEIIYFKYYGGCLWYNKNNNGHIWIIYIEKEYRGKGYSDKLLSKTVDRIKKKRFKVCTAFVKYSNTQSIKLFLRNGFISYGLILHKDFIKFKKEL